MGFIRFLCVVGPTARDTEKSDEYGMVPKEMLEIASILWNASFMPSDMQRKAVEDVVNVLPSDNTEARREMFLIAHMLLERKKQYFSDN